MTRLDDLLITEQFWFADDGGTIHCVFAKSAAIAMRFARAKGLTIHITTTPLRIFPLIIHNANSWYARLILPEYES